MALATNQQSHDAPQAEHLHPAHDHAPVDHVAPAGTGALARVQAVRANGWAAVEEIVAIVRHATTEWPQIASWLHQQRGNGFVQQVTGELSGQPRASTKFPIVLLHGFNSAPGGGMSFSDAVKDGMRADGDLVFEVTAPPFQSPAERAKAIAPQLEEILKKTGAAKLNLIAHSLGGLDARYLISSMGWADRIASLSTVGTPHHGTHTADLANKLPHAMDPALDSVGQWIGKSMDHNAMADNVNVRANMQSMSEGEAEKFNAANPDRKGVYYQSWGGVSTFGGHLNDKEVAQVGPIAQPHGDPHQADRLNPALYLGAMTAGSAKNGELNDGAVPLESAKWGNYQGTVMGDHWDMIGQDGAGPNKRTGFDPVEFYRQMAGGLSKRGY